MKLFRLRPLAEKIEEHERKERFRRFRHFFARKWKKILLYGFLTLFSIGLIGSIAFVSWVLRDVPDPSELRDLILAETSVIYDSTGTVVLYNIHGDENRKYISLNEMSPDMITAILAAEDAEFYEHQGIDLMGMFRSMYYLVRTGEIRGGGSTITQQLVKVTLLTPEQTISRKIKEIYLAFRIEKEFTKEQILELYLNKVPFGNNAFGIEQASLTYFGKPAKDLTMAESTVLASLPQAPSKWSPYGQRKETQLLVTEDFFSTNSIETPEQFFALHSEENPLYLKGLFGKSFSLPNGTPLSIGGRVDDVLNQMRDKKFISEFEYEKTKTDLQNLVFVPYHEEIKAPHFVFYVRDVLEAELEKTLGAEDAKNLIEQGGLKIYTTLDYPLQQKAEELIKKHAERNDDFGVSNIAMVSSEPSTGYIKVMVGSRDYWLTEIGEDEEKQSFDGKVNVVLQRRQPGSSFKPIIYAAAFAKGLSPATVLFDVKTKFGSSYPNNFDGKFRGPVTIRYSIGNSLNIPALKTGMIVDDEDYNLAQKMGIGLLQGPEFYGASLALGAGETRPLDMLQAYSIFATGGKKIPLTPILWVEDKNGNILLDYRNPPENPEVVLDEETAYLVTNVLSDAEARGPGWNSHLQLAGRVNAVKTGTSNAVDKKTGRHYPNDLWTIGFTPQLSTVVWSGNNVGAILNNSADGWENSAPLFKEFMEFALEGKPVELFPRPAGIKTIAVDRFSGKLPPEGLPEEFIVKEIFSSKNAPTEVSDAIQFVEIDKASGKLPTEFTPPSALEKRIILNFHDYDPKKFPEWEAGVKAWVEEKGAEYVRGFGAESVLASPPTGSDDVHTPETAVKKPQIMILSPSEYGIVTPPYVDVSPDIQAGNGLRKVEFYWDGELKTTVTKSPWRATLEIGSPENGTTHTVKVRAIDQYYYDNAAEISVKIGVDDTPPSLTFLFPQDEETMSGGVLHTFRVSAVDNRSAVDKVIFTLDGQQLGVIREEPYEVMWQSPNQDSSHTLHVKAFDTSGNVMEQEIRFYTSEETASESFGILSPSSGDSSSSPLFITGSITSEHRLNLSSLEVWGKLAGGTPKIITSFSDVGASNTFSTVWESTPGAYQIWIKVKLQSGGSEISEKTNVTIL